MMSNRVQNTVKHMYQWDSQTWQGHRMCFSSSMAMILEKENPDVLDGPQEDDQWLRIINQKGDTTNCELQAATLRANGLPTARFVQNATPALIKDRSRRGLLTGVGWLIHGHYTAPRGGGHWSVIVGFDDDKQRWIVHDPNGECDLVNGGYKNHTNGAYVEYSYKHFNARFLDANGRGWAIVYERPGSPAPEPPAPQNILKITRKKALINGVEKPGYMLTEGDSFFADALIQARDVGGVFENDMIIVNKD